MRPIRPMASRLSANDMQPATSSGSPRTICTTSGVRLSKSAAMFVQDANAGNVAASMAKRARAISQTRLPAHTALVRLHRLKLDTQGSRAGGCFQFGWRTTVAWVLNDYPRFPFGLVSLC